MSAQSSRMYPSTHAAPRLHSDWIPSNFRCNPCSPRQVSRCTRAKDRRTGWDCIPISAPVVRDLPGGAGAIALVAVLMLDEGVAAIVDAVVLLALPFPARNQAHILPVAVQSPPTTIRRAMRRPVFFSCLLLSSWLRNDGQSRQITGQQQQ